MSSRPLERVPTIRGKLGSTIVVAVAITLLISYALIGFALRNTPKDSEAIDAPGARQAPRERQVADPPPDTMVVRRTATGEVTVEGVNLGVLPPDTPGRLPALGRDRQPRVGVDPDRRRRQSDRALPVADPRVPGPHVGDARVPAELNGGSSSSPVRSRR